MMTCHHATRIWLRPQASHQAPRPHWRPSMRCSALRSHLLPPPGQSAGGKKKVNAYKGSFFIWLRHWHARNLSSSMPPTQGHVGLGDAVLRRGAVARGAIRGTAIAVHRRRNTDPPAMAGPPAVGTPCKQAPRQLHQPGLIDGCVMRINSASIVNQSAHTYS